MLGRLRGVILLLYIAILSQVVREAALAPGVCQKEDDVGISQCESAADNGTYICVNSTNYCDGHIDCADHEDEKFCCDAEQYTCSLDYRCINATKICDGVNDCTANDDENCAPCNSSSFECNTDLCIPLSSKCDGKNDCIDHSDELECTTPIDCTYDQFRCSNSECLDDDQKCDGVEDCEDGSDEDDCGGGWNLYIPRTIQLGWLGGVIGGLVGAAIGIGCGVRNYLRRKKVCRLGPGTQNNLLPSTQPSSYQQAVPSPNSTGMTKDSNGGDLENQPPPSLYTYDTVYGQKSPAPNPAYPATTQQYSGGLPPLHSS